MLAKTLEEDAQITARRNMVENNIRPGGVRLAALIDMMHRTAREPFVPYDALAYADCEVEIAAGRRLLSPLALARLIELAAPKSGELVLDIACGSGYGSALLAGLVDTVIALEEDAALVEKMSAQFAALGIDNAVAICGALAKGQPKQAPFDIILVNGCVATRPEALCQQLAEGGRLVCAVPRNGVSKAVIYRRIGNGFSERVAFDVSAPQLQSFRAPTRFAF